MFRCPHCTGQGVSAIGKLIASPWAPATCKLCAGKCSESILPTQILRGTGFIATIIAALASLIYSSWIPILASTSLVFLAFGALQIWAPLQPLSGAQFQARKSGRRMQVALLLIVGSLLAGLGYFLDA